MVQARIRTGFLAASLAMATASLGGCGFTPLYAEQGVSANLSAVAVHVQKGRTGFLLSQDLEDSLARDRTTAPRYRLDIMLIERDYPRGLTINDVAIHNETHITITYHLVELATGKTLKTGVEPIEVTYAIANQPYAGVAAQQDSQERAAAAAADRIRSDLAVYFAHH